MPGRVCLQEDVDQGREEIVSTARSLIGCLEDGEDVLGALHHAGELVLWSLAAIQLKNI